MKMFKINLEKKRNVVDANLHLLFDCDFNGFA